MTCKYIFLSFLWQFQALLWQF